MTTNCSSISRASAEPDPGWVQKTTANASEVACGWSVANTVFYNVIITVRRRRFVRRLLVAYLPQYEPLT